MSKIRVDLEATAINGQALTFKAPADCSQITGLIVYYPEGSGTSSKEFKFVDAHGVDVGKGSVSLFAKNALVKVMLDTDAGKAYIQNADTNDYLEAQLAEKFSPGNPPAKLTIGSKTYNGTAAINMTDAVKTLIDAKIVCGTTEVSNGDASTYPEGTLYIVIE